MTTWIVNFDSQIQSVQALQYNFSYCVQIYNTIESSGQTTTEVIKKYDLDSGLSFTNNSNLDSSFYMPGDITTYNLEAGFHSNLGSALSGILDGKSLALISAWTTSGAATDFSWRQGNTPASQGLASIYNLNVASPSETISMIFGNIATSLSNK